MLSREYGYTEEYIDWQLDTDRIFIHIEYLKDNPPAGAVLKQFIEAYFGAKKNTDNQPQPEPEVSNSLEDFIADFTGCGGSIK
jgi:hypothetical protein